MAEERLDVVQRHPVLNEPRADHRRLGVQYIIWRQRIWNATRSDDRGRVSWASWRRMDDRGSPTENHMDHIHSAS